MATTDPPAPTSPRDADPDLTDLLARHGVLMDGRALAALFKFGSSRSFRRAAQNGALPVSVFRIAGRRGWFARSRDVAAWLASAGALPTPPASEDAPMT
jgi:hypothetical protein